MPINALRPAPAYTLGTLTNGQVLADTTLNEFQNAMNNFAGRGATTATLLGGRLNGLIHVPVGLVSKGYANSFQLQRIQLAIPLWLSAGFDVLGFGFQVRLNSMYPMANAPAGFVGSTFTVEVVRGGVAYQVAQITWRDLVAATLQTGFFTFNHPLSSLFLNSPIHCEEIWIRLTYDATEGDDSLLGLYPNGILTNPEFWNGCGYFFAAAYKNFEPC